MLHVFIRWDMRICMIVMLMWVGAVEASEGETMKQEVVQAPQYLYKILTFELWEKSQNKEVLELPPMDDAFIHFSTEAQVEKTASKFFANDPKYVILKVDTHKLKGDLVYESNPGSTSKYYHIYNGSIPRAAVVECRVVEE